MNNIDPELLRRILAGETVDGYGLGRGNYIGPQPSEANDPTGDPRMYEQVIYRNVNDPTWGQAVWDTYETDGRYRGRGSGDSDALGLAKFLATAVGGYYGTNALNGMMAGGATGAAGLGGEAFGAGLGEGATLTGGSTLTSGAPVFGTTLADAGAAGTMGGLGSAGSAVSAGSALSNASNAAKAGSGLNWGSALGAVAGALDSKDKQQTSNREPWAPAQPYLRNVLSTSQGLLDHYKANPYSADQQAYTQRINGLLNQQNDMMPGLLSQAQALGKFRRG